VVKILTYYFNFAGAKPHLVSDAHAEHMRRELMHMLSMRISSLRICSACAPVPYVYAQHGL
jgi:hypothetical protein